MPSLCQPSAFASIVGALSIRAAPSHAARRGSAPSFWCLPVPPDPTLKPRPTNPVRPPARSPRCTRRITCRVPLDYGRSWRTILEAVGVGSRRRRVLHRAAALHRPAGALCLCACLSVRVCARAYVRLSVLAPFLPPSLPPGEDGPLTSTPVLPPPPTLALSPSFPDCHASLHPTCICLAVGLPAVPEDRGSRCVVRAVTRK